MLSRKRFNRFRLFVQALASILLTPAAGLPQSLPKVTVNRVDLTEKLRKAQFDTLNAELTSYEAKAERDPRFEMNAIVAFGAFDCGNTLTASGLNDWVKAAPNSYTALTARATCLVSLGQRVRGDGAAVDVPKQNADAMAKYLIDAVRDAGEAIKIDQNLAPAYALQIKAFRIYGTEAQMARAKADALSMVPWSFALREQLMYAARPRWGGSRQQMQQLADSSQYYAQQNPAMQFLKAWIPIDEGDDFADQNQWPQAVEKYTDALKVGGEYWTSYRRRANAYYAMQQWQKAFDDGLRSNELYPSYSENLRLLALASGRLEEPEPSILYLGEYMRYEMPDAETMDLLSSDQRLLKAQGKENW